MWGQVGLVFVGGMLGTAARAGLTLVFADILGPWLVPLLNIGGAFALGLVIGAISRREATPRSRAVQLFIGTGVLGGFTTYSALAVESTDPVLLGVGIGCAIAGTAAAGGGLALARARGRSVR